MFEQRETEYFKPSFGDGGSDKGVYDVEPWRFGESEDKFSTNPAQGESHV